MRSAARASNSAVLRIVGMLCVAFAPDASSRPPSSLAGDGKQPAAPVAEVAPANARKRRQLQEVEARLNDSFDLYYGGRWIPHLRSELAKAPADAPFDAVYELKSQLAEWLLREGGVEEAIALYNELGQAISESSGGGAGPGTALLKSLAVAYLRQAEQANCLCQRSGDSCLFPLSEEGRHTEREGAERAVLLLSRALEITPEDLQSAWLLNFAHMALGSHPAGVPPLHRIPASRFESEHDIGRFEDVAPRLGLTTRTCAGGAALDDFDGNGHMDIIVSSMELSTPMAYYRNEGDGTFTDISEQSGLSSQVGALNFIHGDIDGDGRLDLYVMRGAWLMANGEIPHSLLLQQEDGSFLDVTEEAGLTLAAPSQVAALADIDLDGDLDLFVGCESMRTRSGWNYPSRLYKNRGDGRFDEIGRAAGVQNLMFCKGASFGDYDGDGWPDLYVSNGGGPNRLYRNQQDGTFVDRASELGVVHPIQSFATWWFDVNNDGWLDLLVTCYDGRDRTAQVMAYYKNGTTGFDSSRLYLNDGAGGFTDATADFGLDRPFFAMGCNFGDFDNDGWPDILFGTGDPEFASLWPNLALRNDGGTRFQDVTTSAGLGHLQKGHGVAFGDIDGDGDQDILVQMGGAFRDDAFWDALYLNPGHGNRWLTVQLRGTRSNRFGVGARIRARIREGEAERDVYSFVGTGGSFGGNSLQAEIGLGQADRLVELEVRWPSGEVGRYLEIALDSRISIVEGSRSPEVLPTRPIDL